MALLVSQSFYCLETDVSVGIGTASEETLGLYREAILTVLLG
jgi:hypothetical protein